MVEDVLQALVAEDLEAGWPHALQVLVQGSQADYAALLGWEAADRPPRLLAGWRIGGPLLTWMTDVRGAPRLVHTLDAPLLLELTDRAFLPRLPALTGLLSMAVFPVRMADALLGALCLCFRRAEPLALPQIQALEAALKPVALALLAWRERARNAFWHEMQDDLRYMVTTSLRDPLYEAMEAVEAGARRRPGEATDDIWERLRAAHERMEALVRGFLEFQELSTTRALRQDPHDLRELLEQVAAEAQVDAGQHKVTLDIAMPPDAVPVLGDGLYLRRMMAHLLRNAVHFTPQGGTVRVTLRVMNDMAELRIRDDGPGIPPAEVERAFRPFHRLAGAEQRGPGAGIGLSLVKQVAERHGGQVRLESRPGQGTTVQVVLPLREDADE